MPSKLLSAVLLTLILTLTITTLTAGEYLSPADFGLKVTEDGDLDYSSFPEGVVPGYFNPDDYEDIALIEGHCLDIYLNFGWGYSDQPIFTRYFTGPPVALRTEGSRYDRFRDLVVMFPDGIEERIKNRDGNLDLDTNPNFFSKFTPEPPRPCSPEFELVWISEQVDHGFNKCAVGDVDNDGIVEIVGAYHQDSWVDSGYMRIYKCTGNDQYELYMEDHITPDQNLNGFSKITMGDIDQDGNKEIIFAYDQIYFWEFSGPGEYTFYTNPWNLAGTVYDMDICDVDQDGILEIATIARNNISGLYRLRVEEFSYKVDDWMIFESNGSFWLPWSASKMDIGDFDNDGAVDIVVGRTAILNRFYFYRYDTTATQNFELFNVQTGINSACVNPIIGDFDWDGQNELFSSGYISGTGSVYMFEPDSFCSGTVTWWDTTTIEQGPNGSVFGYVDGNPSVLSIHNDPPHPYHDTNLLLWTFPDSVAVEYWLSPPCDSSFYDLPVMFDADQDGGMDIIVGDNYSNRLSVWDQVGAGIAPGSGQNLPGVFELHQNYPNPFNAETAISFKLQAASKVELKVFDITGREAASLVTGHLSLGQHSVVWDAEGRASGIYFARMTCGKEQAVVKLMLLK